MVGIGKGFHYVHLYFIFLLPLACGKGYLVFCPCMGRIGNQMEQYLGALAFAKGLNRTVILPPLVEYHPGLRKSVQVPLKTYFKTSQLAKFHRVISMETFMSNYAEKVWPAGKRTVLCYGKRHGPVENDCNAKDGNPFGSFWDTFSVDFERSEFYAPLGYDTDVDTLLAQEWNSRFPPAGYPVLAFTGAPGAFPMRERHVKLHSYLVWSDSLRRRADEFISEHLPRPLLALHLRNGPDWEKACEHIPSDRNLFGSAQCLGYRLEHGQPSTQLCFPSDQQVLSQIKQTAEAIGARSVFIASDYRPMLAEISHRLKKFETARSHLTQLKARKLDEPDVHLDLAILTRADHYVANCYSTFSALAARMRPDMQSTTYWAFAPTSSSATKEEL